MTTVNLTGIIRINNRTLHSLINRSNSRHWLNLNDVPRLLMYLHNDINRKIVVIMLNRMSTRRNIRVNVLRDDVVLRRLQRKTMIRIMSRTLLHLRLITVNRDGVVRLITGTGSRRVLAIYPYRTRARPRNGLHLRDDILPMTCSSLTACARAATSVSRLPVTIHQLIRIRGIRVRHIPESLLIVLYIRIRRKLIRSLRALSPRLHQQRNIRPYSSTRTNVTVINDLRRHLRLLHKINNALVRRLRKRYTQNVRPISRLVKIAVSNSSDVTAVRRLYTDSGPRLTLEVAVIRGVSIDC